MRPEDLIELTDFEIAEGWRRFSAKYPHNDIEFGLRHFLAAEKSGDWLHKARISSLLSIREMGKRLGITSACYHRLEIRAKSGDISLKNLERCAEAMGCEVVYAIRPKSRIGFAVKIWEFLLSIVRRDERLYRIEAGRRGLALARFAERLLYDPKFRKAQGWAKNREDVAYDTRKMIEAYNIRNVSDPKALEKMLARMCDHVPEK